MKKMFSLAAMFAALSYASPASAELNFSGDASVRARETSLDADHQAKDDLYYQYRIRLNAAADLGDGYFFKSQLSNERPGSLGGGGGWQTVGYGNTEVYTLGVSQFYFGRYYGASHFIVGRFPLNSTNNPVYDIYLYPKNPLDIPTTTFNNDRIFGVNYGTKIGSGDLNAVVAVFDNQSASDTAASGDGLLNDGYVVSLAYKAAIGNVTVEPQVVTALTKHDVVTQTTYSDGFPFHQGIRPVAVGANVAVPAGKVNLGFSGFYTRASGTTPDAASYGPGKGANVDYTGYLLRVKAEYGPVLAWYDYNKTTDKSAPTTHEYTNQFVWAQYQYKVYQAAKGSLTIQPTLRYLTSSDHVGGNIADVNTSRLRSELWATVSF